MSILEKYLKVTDKYQIPEYMQAVELTGVGEENLKLTTVKIPKCGDRQLLGRVDAVNPCASDNKLIDQGSEHPLLYGWDTEKYPIIIGHEGTVTIVKVGKKMADQYKVGEKFAVQPAVPTGPLNYKERYKDNAKGIDKIAVGYTLPGLFAEYVLITEEVIDTGCLLPFPKEEIPYFGAALAEPISDVVAAHERMVHILKDSLNSPRRAVIGPKKGGVTLIIGTGPMGLMHIEVAMNWQPAKLIISELLDQRRERAKTLFQDKAKLLGIQIFFVTPNNLEKTIEKETGGAGVDDVIVALGIAKIQEYSLNYLGRGGVANLFGGTKYQERMIQIDTHKIHYDGITAVGSSGSDPSDVSRALDMIAEGKVDPGNYVVRCGGLDAAIPIIRAIRRKELDGKGVIYPHTKSELFTIKGWNLQKERKFLEDNLIRH
jgi:threonine dehydrogenase-like Zn-dependent dehydrogenase